MPLPPIVQAVWDAGEVVVRWVGSAWEPYPAIADPTEQRRLVLRAVRECAPDEWKEACREQFTFEEVDGKLREYLWFVVFLCWFLFPLLAFAEIVPWWRVRRALIRNHRQWLAESDPLVTQIVLEGDVRRVFKALPRKHRNQLKSVIKELDEVHRHWDDFHMKLQVVYSQLHSDSSALMARRNDLAARISLEKDPVTLGSLERQLRSLDGEMEARAGLETWRNRLEAGREECTQGLLHLKSRLALLTASGPGMQSIPIEEAATELHAFNARLAQTQAATEEVLRLGA